MRKFPSPDEAETCAEKDKADTGFGPGAILKRGELTVQRLSSEVSGKAQTFSRIGARIFVPFAEYEEITLPNIKLACEKHFLPTAGKSVMCGVLAGEQGPSCSTLEQIPYLKQIHIRFIQRQEQNHVDSNVYLTPDDLPKKEKRTASSVPTVSSFVEMQSPWSPKHIKVFPKSLSVSDMLKLGQVVQKKATTLIEMSSFELDPLGWSLTATTIEFNIE